MLCKSKIVKIIVIIVAISLAIGALPVAAFGNIGNTHEVIRLTNIERANLNAQRVVSDPLLTQLANIRAREIARESTRVGRVTHYRPNGESSVAWVMAQSNGRFTSVGENLTGSRPSMTPARAVDMWMTSPLGHRETLIDGVFNLIGVGYYNDGTGEFWVQLFATGEPVASAAQPPIATPVPPIGTVPPGSIFGGGGNVTPVPPIGTVPPGRSNPFFSGN